MTDEVLEAELSKLNGKVVYVVRPMFGSQSDSYMGTLWVQNKKYPLQFLVNAASLVMLFTTDDVSTIEPPKNDGYSKIIRLKGPHNYKEKYEEIKN